MRIAQSALLSPLPHQARVLLFSLRQPLLLNQCLKTLSHSVDGFNIAMGLGWPTLQRLNICTLEGLDSFPSLNAPTAIPSTPYALWLWLRSDEMGDLFHLSRQLVAKVSPTFHLEAIRDLFLYQEGRDLSGYRDGTENPTGDKISDIAFIHENIPGVRGSSFLALQTWQHRWEVLDQLSEAQKDQVIGRTRKEDQELEDAAVSAHVRRTAQEDFVPEAYLWRRSMPWIDGERSGLLFQSFSANLKTFEQQITRMSGAEDGICDQLFEISTPIDGAYFWCPPMHQGALDLRALQI